MVIPAFLVQCKHWKAYNVGVKEARELFGIVAAERADGGILVTCGDFTREARAFAAGNPLDLLDGSRLLELVRSAQAGSREAQTATPTATTPRACPRCGQPMVVRTAKRGPQAGSRFLGCTAYPKCQATAPLPD